MKSFANMGLILRKLKRLNTLCVQCKFLCVKTAAWALMKRNGMTSTWEIVIDTDVICEIRNTIVHNVKMHELNLKINCANEINPLCWSKCEKCIVQCEKIKKKRKASQINYAAIFHTIGMVLILCVRIICAFFIVHLIKWRSMCDWISALRFAWLIYNCKVVYCIFTCADMHSAVISLYASAFVRAYAHTTACTLTLELMLFFPFVFKHKTMSMIYKSYDVCRLNDCR